MHLETNVAPAGSGLKLFGIAHCDSVKRARQCLNQRGVAHEFVDFKKHGVSVQALAGWARAVGWECLINRRGTTWRGLSAADQAVLQEPTQAAFALVQTHTSVIKRPVVEWPDGAITVGMDEAVFASHAVGG